MTGKRKRKAEKIVFGGVYLIPAVMQDRKISGVEQKLICDIGWSTSRDREYKYKFSHLAVKFGVTRKAIRNAVERLKAAKKVFETGQDDYHHNLHLSEELSRLFEKAEQHGEAGEQPPKGKKVYAESSEEFQLAKLLLDEIRARKSDFKQPNLQAWAHHIDLLIRKDQRTPERIRQVILWTQADTGNGDPRWKGWQNNILSGKKLREKFDKLELNIQGQIDGSSNENRGRCEATTGGFVR